VFPNGLKFSIHQPIFKNAVQFITSNCRLISLLISFSKVFEKLIYSKQFTQLCTNDTPVNEQYGFRPNISNARASYNSINEIPVAMNNQMSVRGLFWDLKKEFDCIIHRLLLDYLEC
jgi:hypothetical protein